MQLEFERCNLWDWSQLQALTCLVSQAEVENRVSVDQGTRWNKVFGHTGMTIPKLKFTLRFTWKNLTVVGVIPVPPAKLDNPIPATCGHQSLFNIWIWKRKHLELKSLLYYFSQQRLNRKTRFMACLMINTNLNFDSLQIQFFPFSVNGLFTQIDNIYPDQIWRRNTSVC